jgi:heterodisulfide reductase subunit C
MNTINLDEAQADFKYELSGFPGAERLMACFACKTCVTSCPVTEVNPAFSPLKLMRMALWGLKQALLSSDEVWLCSSCYTCQERCPMEVRITDILTQLKNMAVREGYAPTGVRAQLDLVKGNGRIYPLDDFDNKKRGKVDLPALPTTCDVVQDLFPSS